MINLPLGDDAAIRAVGYHTEYGGFIDALGPAARRGRQRRPPHRRPHRAPPSSRRTDITITPRIVYQEIDAERLQPAGGLQPLRQPVHHDAGPRVTFDEREQYLLLREDFKDDTFLADLNVDVDLGGVALTSVTTYINRDILVSRDASALTGSVSVDLGYPERRRCCCRPTWSTPPIWRPSPRKCGSPSNSDGPFQWLVGVFYSDVDRFYTQRLPTPGYDAATDARLGAGTSAASRNGFPANSPYNADLPYDIKQ